MKFKKNLFKKMIALSLVTFICIGIMPSVVFANNEKQTFTVQFELDGGIQINDTPLIQNTVFREDSGTNYISILDVPIVEKAGYQFAGWIDNKNPEELMVDLNNIKRDCTLTAVWYVQKTDAFILNYEGDGGVTANGETFIAENINSSSFKIATNAFSKVGYDFRGWKLFVNKTEVGSYAENEIIDTTTTMVDEVNNLTMSNLIKLGSEVKFVAQWAKSNENPINFLITYEGNDGTTTSGETFIAENISSTSFKIMANTFSKVGYDFRGWKLFVNGIEVGDYAENEIIDPTTIIVDKANNLTMSDLIELGAKVNFVAQWGKSNENPMNFIVTYEGNGGVTTNGDAFIAEDISSTSFKIATNTFSKAGYDFRGWKLFVNGIEVGDYAENEIIDSTIMIVDKANNLTMSDLVELGSKVNFVAQWNKKSVESSINNSGPHTGDTTQLALYFTCLLLATVGIATIVIKKYNHRTKY